MRMMKCLLLERAFYAGINLDSEETTGEENISLRDVDTEEDGKDFLG